MTDSTASYLQASGKNPEGTREALAMLSAHLAGHRECAASWRVQSSNDGLGRSQSDVMHHRAIVDFTVIHKTLQDAVAFASPKQSPAPPVLKRGNAKGFNMYELLNDRR
jgi:hypothetical protein